MDESEHLDDGLEAAEAARAEAEAAAEARVAAEAAPSSAGPTVGTRGPGDLLREPATCPFLRLAVVDELRLPLAVPDGAHRCVALPDPSPVSARQQALVCLTASHVDCPRFLRGSHVLPVLDTAARRALPRATLAAAAVLVASLVATVAYTAANGGLSLPLAGTVSTPSAAVVPSPRPSASAAPVGSPGSTPAATVTPAVASPAEGPTPTVASSSPSPPSAAPTAAPSPTSDRYALLVPCADRPACYVYTVRAGDNLTSIGLYFGVPFDTILRLNPSIGDPANIHAGDRIILPPPTR